MSHSQTLMTPREVADLLDISLDSVRRYAREGRLTRITLGHRTRRYRRADVLRLVRESEDKTTKTALGSGLRQERGRQAANDAR